MHNKFDARLLDVNLAPTKDTVSETDFVLASLPTGETRKVSMASIIAAAESPVILAGEALMQHEDTTLTKIKIYGDPDNEFINVGVAPTGGRVGTAYVVTTTTPIETKITGETREVRGGNEIVWTGTQWSIVAIDIGVSTVNGMKGDVILNAGHVGAVAKTGDTMIGTLSFSTGVSEIIQDAAGNRILHNGGYLVLGNSKKNLRIDSVDASITLADGVVKANKPFVTEAAQSSAINSLTRKDYVDSQVNAVKGAYVKKAGDTMTGNLSITRSGESRVDINAGVNANALVYLTEDGKQHGAYIKYNGSGDNYTYFGTKQSGTEKHAFRIERGTSVTRFAVQPVSDAPQSTVFNSLTRKDYVDTAIENSWKMRKNISNQDLNSIRTEGRYYGYQLVNAPNSSIATVDVKVYSADWLVQEFHMIRANEPPITYRRSWNNATNWSKWAIVYDSYNKPSALDISAMMLTPRWRGTSSAPLDLDTLSVGWTANYGGHAYWTNKPKGLGYGTLEARKDGNNGYQIAFDNAHASTTETTGKMWYRTSRSNAGENEWGVWAEVYTSENKPSVSDLNAVAKTGDTMTGALKISTTAANGLEINTGSRNGDGAVIKFSDIADTQSQYGTFGFRHQDSQSYGGDAAFVVSGNQARTNFVLTGSGNFKVGNNEVYHEGHKPTVTEIGLDGLSMNQDGKPGLKIKTPSGSGWFGMRNATWFHMDTDASSGFYMYRPLQVNSTIRGVSGIISDHTITTGSAVPQSTYGYVRASNGTRGGKMYLRRLCGGSGDTIWHETVQAGVWRLATGSSDTNEIFRLTETGAGYIKGSRIYTEDFKPSANDIGAVNARALGLVSDYNQVVVLLHKLDNTNISANFYFNGEVQWKRSNQLAFSITAKIDSGKHYDSEDALGTALFLGSVNNGGFRTVTCMYEGVKWLALKISHTNAQGYVYVNGRWSDEPKVVVYRNDRDAGTIVNEEVYESLVDADLEGPSSFSGNLYAGRNNLVYHTGNKPTWTDVGGGSYIKENGANLQVAGGKWLIGGSDTTGFASAKQGTGASAVGYLGHSGWWFKEAWVNSYRGGSIDVTGSIVTGTSLVKSGTGGTLISIPNAPVNNIQYINWKGGNDILSFKRGSLDDNNTTDITAFGTLNATVQLKENGQRVYSPNNKPSATDIGALTQSTADGRYWKRTDTVTNATNAGYLTARDDRDVKPNTSGTNNVKTIRPFFVANTTFPDLEVAGTYSDFLLMDTYSDTSGGKVNGLIFSKSNNKLFHVQGGWNSDSWDKPSMVYTEANKPSASDINAVAKTGDTMTGELQVPTIRITKEGGGFGILNNNAHTMVRQGVDSETIVGNYSGATIIDALDEVIHVRKAGDIKKRIYHEGFKPTWADVGGNGYWTIDSSGHMQAAGSRWVKSSNGSLGFLPAASATGDSSVSHLGTSSWWFNSAWVNSYRGGSVNVTGSVSAHSLDVSAVGNAIHSSDLATGAKQLIGASPTHGVFVGNIQNNLNLECKTNPQVNIAGDVYKLYHEGFKPTAADVGAIPSSSTGGTPVAAYYTTTSGESTGVKIRLPFKTNSSKMVTFTVRMYQGYNHYDIQFSGYLYSSQNQWYSPKVTCISSTSASGISVAMGRDDEGYAYVWLAGAAYSGVAVFNVVAGYNTGDWNTGWVISRTDEQPNVALTRVVYPPYSKNNAPSWGDISGKPTTFPVAPHTHTEYVKKAGDTMSGVLTVKSPSVVRDIADTVDASIIAPYVNVGSELGFVPLTRMGAQYSSGYRTVVTTGIVKNSSSWGEGVSGFFVGMGGNDSHPTEYFTMAYGGKIKHSRGHEFYSTAFKPTATDVGALSINGGTLTGTLNYRFLNKQTTSNLDTCGDSSGFSVFYVNSSATGKPTGTDHAVMTFSFSSAWQTQMASDWRTNRWYVRGQNSSSWSSWAELYTTANKPTAADVGALPSSGKAASATISDYTTVLDTRGGVISPDGLRDKSATFQFTTQQSPCSSWVSKLSVAGWGNGYRAWEIGSGSTTATSDVNDRKLWFRTGISGTWDSWEEVYTSGNKPNAADVNAVSKSGDTMTSALKISGTTAGNTTPDNDQIKLDGYGLIGNRGTLYVTNAWSGGTLAFGIGGNHNVGKRLVISRSDSRFYNPVVVEDLTDSTLRTTVNGTGIKFSSEGQISSDLRLAFYCAVREHPIEFTGAPVNVNDSLNVTNGAEIEKELIVRGTMYGINGKLRLEARSTSTSVSNAAVYIQSTNATDDVLMAYNNKSVMTHDKASGKVVLDGGTF